MKRTTVLPACFGVQKVLHEKGAFSFKIILNGSFCQLSEREQFFKRLYQNCRMLKFYKNLFIQIIFYRQTLEDVIYRVVGFELHKSRQSIP